MFKFQYDATGGKLRQGSTDRNASVGRGRTVMRDRRAATMSRKGTGAGSGGFAPYPAGGGNVQRYSPVYDRAEAPTLAEEYLPTDVQTQNKIFQSIVMFDPIAGPATEYWADLAFSNRILLSGVADDKVLQEYNDAISASNIAGFMPELVHSYLTYGRFVMHQIMDEKRGYWTDTIVHDPSNVSIKVSPFSRQPPRIDLDPTDEMTEWATSQDPRALAQRREVDPVLVKLMAAGKPIPLAPENTMFMPRKAYATDHYGSSYLTRILPYWIYEKALVDASVAGARRRAGPLRHIKVPVDYTAWEMDALVDQFFAAEEDQLGGYILTRAEVDVVELTGGRDTIWKLSDEWDFLSSAKMRALGISETLLSGEANWNSLEMVVSVFLEKIRAVRQLFTRRVIVEHMLMTLARLNDFTTTTTQAHLAHGIRIARGRREYTEDELLIPTVEWDRPIEPIGDETYMDLLDRLQDKGLPVPVRMLSQAAGYDLDKAMSSFEADLETRKKIYQYQVGLAQLQQQYGIDETGAYVGSEFGGGEEEDLGGGFGLEEEEEPLFGGEEEGGGGFETEAPAAPEAPAGGEGGEEGAGASLENARFPVETPPGQSRVVVATEPRTIMDKLNGLPIWDGDGAFFGMPKRRYAKMLNDIRQTDPAWTARQRLAKTLPRTWRRNENLSELQTQMTGYLAMRLGLLPPMKLKPQTYGLVRQWLGQRMNGEGLTGSLSKEIVALNRLSELVRTNRRQKNMDAFERDMYRKRKDRSLRQRYRGEGRLADSELLTGKVID